MLADVYLTFTRPPSLIKWLVTSDRKPVIQLESAITFRPAMPRDFRAWREHRKEKSAEGGLKKGSSDFFFVPHFFCSTETITNPYWCYMCVCMYIYTLWIQTLSEKVLKPPNYSKLYPKHFLRRYLDP